jgi:hypothetical protein
MKEASIVSPVAVRVKKNLEEVEDKLRDLLDLGPDAEREAQRARAIEPAFERSLYDQPLGREWLMPYPSSIPALEQRIDLIQTLRAINPQLISGRANQQLEPLRGLSSLLNKMRDTLTKRPSTCEVEIFYRYATLLKWLSKFFFSLNVSFPSYWSANESQPFVSPVLILEYLNVLLLLVIRLASDAQRHSDERKDPNDADRESRRKLRHCEMIMKEAEGCVAHIASGKFTLGDRWLYRVSPRAIGSASLQRRKANDDVEEECERLRSYVERELGGERGLKARRLLFTAKAGEYWAWIIERSARDSGEELIVHYDTLRDAMPDLCNVSIAYEAIARNRKDDSRVRKYASFMSHYWFMWAHILLMEREVAIYEAARETDDYVAVGQSALKRTEMLLDEMDRMEHALERLPLDETLRGDYRELCRHLGGYDRLHQSITTAYSYNPQQVVMAGGGDAATTTTTTKPLDYRTEMETKLKQLLQQEPAIGDAFEQLRQLQEEERVMPQLSLRTGETEVVTQDALLSIEARIAGFEERVRTMEWLLALKRDAKGRILIPSEAIDSLDAEYALCKEKLAKLKIQFIGSS